jgi:hypothetical protein
MRHRLLGAAFAAGLVAFFVSATPCRADIVRLRDGKVLPGGAVVEPGQVPTDEEMEKFRGKKLEPLGYDVTKIGGVDVPPGMIQDAWVYDNWVSPEFQDAERSAAGGISLAEAADTFHRAAQEMKGSAKQVSLAKRAMALALANDVDGMIAAIDELQAEFPKTFFLAELERRRAGVLAGKGQSAQAATALDKVIGAPGLNKHDLYDARVFKVYLTQYVTAGRDRARWAEVEKAYRELLSAIEGEALARAEVEDSRLRVLVGIGRSLVFQGKQSDARKFLEQVVSGTTASSDATMLAPAYVGLGDVMVAEARETQNKAAGNPALKKQAADQLEAGLLHYLRVAELYHDRADPNDVYQARLGAGRAFASLFGASNDTDCDTAAKADQFLRAAISMVPSGVERSQLVREFLEFKARKDKACK